jgi:hypothetical protein
VRDDLGGDGCDDGVTVLPYVAGSRALESAMVRQELAALVAANQELVRLGEAYGRWDRAGRLAYLDALEAVEGRWRVFIARWAGRSV